ncbi:hypothetical protein QTP88_029146 [Uroleucon formosanum]
MLVYVVRVTKIELRNIEQWYAIKFCVKLGESAKETFDKIVKVFGDEAMSRAQVFRWHKEFKNGREGVEDELRSGRAVEVRTDNNVQRMRALVRQDMRLTIRMLSDELNINRETVRKILIKDLSMKKLCAKMYDPETKRQSQQWLSPGSARPKKARMSKSKVKTIMICFFDSNGLVHKEFFPPGQTVNQQFYIEVLERLRKRIIRVRPEIANIWILHHDNAPCHRAFSVTQFLTSKNIRVFPQPPYSPDMSLCDFFLFPRIKQVVKGTHFDSVKDIQTSVTRVLQELPVNDIQKSYENWKKRWTQCVAAQGE